MGNLHSLAKALCSAGADVSVTGTPADLDAADIAVLPGVGAFGAVMEAAAPARSVLLARHQAGRPILAVCIGMQILHEASEEAPGIPGLGILPGPCRRLPRDAGKVPHMGWNTLTATREGPLTRGLDGAHVYYVHSYAAAPGPCTLATTTFGAPFAAIEQDGRTLAFQFHPEKSSAVGRILLTRAVESLGAQ